MEAYIKNVRISPKKLRFLMDEIKKRKPSEVLDYLFYMPSKNAQVFYKAIKSAVDNAKNNLKLNPEELVFEKLTVEEGQKLRRFKAGGRGTVKPFKRRYSHIRVVLKSSQNKKEAVAKKTEEPKKLEEKKEEPKKEPAKKQEELKVKAKK